MAFVVEDGTGLQTATAYISVAFFQSHHTDRGRNISSFSDTEIEGAIVRSTDYIDKRFGRKFRGTRRSKAQALEWPRLDPMDDDEYLLNDLDDVPRQLQKATAEYALRALNLGELAPDPQRPTQAQDFSSEGLVTQSGDIVTGQVKSISSKAGPVSESKTYATTAELASKNINKAVQSSLVSDFNIPEYPEADLWLQELLKSSTTRGLVRGS